MYVLTIWRNDIIKGVDYMHTFLFVISAGCAGAVTGLMGTGGGSVLVTMLMFFRVCQNDSAFKHSISVMLPICITVLLCSECNFSFLDISIYLAGSILGGVSAGIWGNYIPPQYLHRVFGAFILWGGVRYLI